MAQPVVFLAFANNEQQRFLDLKSEDDFIYELFQANPTHTGLSVHRDQFTTAKKLTQYLTSFKNRISIFHFAGHASKAKFYLTDENGRMEGLALLLAQQENLKCVFLNGCDTSGFVMSLLEHKVPVVIATDRDIDDLLAVTFAYSFFNSLTKGNSIKESYDSAKGAVQLEQPKSIEVRTVDGKLADIPQDGCPWGIYYSNEESLNWRISDAQSDVLGVPKNFWVRFAVLFAAIFIFFTWSNRHIGTSSTAFFLANGPLALIGISSFLVGLFGYFFSKISPRGKKIALFFLKTPVLTGISLMVFLLALTGTSIAIKHPGGSPLHLRLTDQQNRNAMAWQIDKQNADESRLLTFVLPFHRSKRLDVAGYKIEPINLKPVIGNRFPLEDLDIMSSLLLRVEPRMMAQVSRIKVIINRPSEPPIIIYPMEKPSLLIGHAYPILNDMKDGWKGFFAYKSVSHEQIERCLSKWGNPKRIYEATYFTTGEKLLISMTISGSLLLTKEVIIENQKINDVLLDH